MEPLVKTKDEPAARLPDDVDSPISWEPSRTFLKYAIAANLVGAVTFLILARVVAPDQPARLVGAVLLALVAVTAWYLLSRRRMQAAINVLAIGVWIIITGASVFNGGVRAPLIAAYPLMILMSGWLISQRSAIVMAALTVAAIIGLVMSESWGLLPYSPPSPPALYGVVQVSLVVLATLIIIFLVHVYQKRLKELDQISSDLARHSRDLQASKAELNRAQSVASVGSWVYDLATDTMRLSPETCRIFALPEGTAGSPNAYLAHTHAKDRRAVDRAWQAALQGDPFDQEYRIMAGNAVRWIRQKAELEFAADGTVLRAVGITQDITERKDAQTAMYKLHRDLDTSRERLRELAAQNETRREGERKHIAREVHDELGQVLTALRMDLSLLGMKSGSQDPALMDRVQGMKGLVDRAIQGVRNVAGNLRPAALDMGLISAIEWLCSDFTERTAIPCALLAREEIIDLDETRAVVIFRIVQESLTNITRYAQASQVDIHLGRRGNELWVQVRDNGRGFDLAAATRKKSFGLLGMRERALALGGRVDIASAPGHGTVIGLTIPIDLNTARSNS
ncbi:MAG: PAS domain-containing protein [Rhodoferax sp.]|uniref:histidine kinase n=1 Tax=Rhodoferax sp. TaxID=50421 RepID=UPI0013FF80C7|nr:histidine kinase [Rhodoferax sp.]NDP38413.1 PAS domain-containing protein [Rhodoferax sp.]